MSFVHPRRGTLRRIEGEWRPNGVENFIGWDVIVAVAEEPLSSPDQSTGTAVLERPEVSENSKLDDGGDQDRYAHYVSKERIAESRLTGRPVVALCGKVWVPKKDPSNYPICPDCKRIFEEMGH
jgi:hypothetical protein